MDAIRKANLNVEAPVMEGVLGKCKVITRGLSEPSDSEKRLLMKKGTKDYPVAKILGDEKYPH